MGCDYDQVALRALELPNPGRRDFWNQILQGCTPQEALERAIATASRESAPLEAR